MIEHLRRKLILICSSITALILAFVCLIAFYIFDGHYEREQRTALKNQLMTVTRAIQQQQTIAQEDLMLLEQRHQLLIHIEDNGTPLLFASQLEPVEVQKFLFESVLEKAKKDYAYNASPFVGNTLELPLTLFKWTGYNHKPYLAALTVFPTTHGHCQIVLLKDLTLSNRYIFSMKLLFIGLVLGGTLLLLLFSFFFVGLVMKPILQNKQKQNEFIAAASHELRAPLTVIETGLSAIQVASDPRSAHFMTLIQSECTRMKGLIGDLLLLARSDAHKWQLQLEDFELDSLLIDLYDGFYPISQKKGITFSLVLPDDLLPIFRGDATRIKQLITILLDNAFTYVPSGKTVTLKAKATEKFFVIQVIDTGLGISTEDQAHIFERFYRSDQSRHEKNHYGLGLSIAQEIASSHHGQLGLSTTPGGGCTFTLHFPLESHRHS